jgi:hypothetical protein
MKTTRRSYSPLLAATLLMGGAFAAPLLAQTAAGTDIKNQATATYTDDPTAPTKFQATSNTVTIQVAEVAGITLIAGTPSNSAPIAGGSFTTNFVITNTGNDPTLFNIPGAATLSNTTGAFTVTRVDIIDENGTVVAKNVPLGGSLDTVAIPPGGQVTVRVTVDVSATAPQGATTTVALGNTATANAQNTPFVNDAGSVRTKDVLGEANGDLPIASEKEAMATSAVITVAGRLQAFATVLKANGTYDPGTNPNIFTDDRLTYNLALRVENPTSPPAGLVVSDLYGTAINVDGALVNRVLISDAIPANTVLGATADITRPNTNWTIVYSTTATGTANQASWQTSRPTAGTITRIGFIYNTNAPAATIDPGLGPILKGSPVISGFSFKVTPVASFTGGTIANIAQVFGQSQPGPVVTGTATQLVYDESGDQTPNNGLNGADPNPTQTPADNGGITDGIANPTRDGIDPGPGTDPTAGTTNQGTDTVTPNSTKPIGGEVTVITIAAAPLTGTVDADGTTSRPGAVGPTNNNDDFTNKAVALPAGLDPATPLTNAQTSAVTFNNSVQNTSTASQTISLAPVPPATATDLPDQTTVTIDPDGPTGPATPVIFTYNQATNTFTPTGTTPTVTLPANGVQNYTVAVDLGNNATQLTAYPVTIAAFIDRDNNGRPDATDPSNLTIDRLYTGYVRLEKDARILEDADNNPATPFTPVAGTAGSYTTDQTALSAAATPNRVIEYRIRYSNISTPVPSSPAQFNVGLPARSLVITEDGTTAVNNWFPATRDPVYTGTGVGSAVDPLGTITVTPNAGDIEIYTDSLNADLAPGQNGTFTFQRLIK